MHENRPQKPLSEIAAPIIAALRTRTARDCFSRTALAITTDATKRPLVDLLLRCRTADEVKELADVLRLRFENRGGLVELKDQDGEVAARAWLFD